MGYSTLHPDRPKAGNLTRAAACILIAIAGNGCASKLPIVPENTPVACHIALPRPVPHIKQKTSGTCWLACAAMVYRYYGIPCTERSIDVAVKRLSLTKRGGYLEGNLRDCMIALAQIPGALEQINQHKAKHSPTTTVQVKPFGLFWNNAIANATITDLYTLIKCLLDEEPAVLICRNGAWSDGEHAVVVVGMRLGLMNNSEPKEYGIISIDVVDPWSDSPEATTWTGDFLRDNFRAVISKTVATDILKQEGQHFQIQP